MSNQWKPFQLRGYFCPYFGEDGGIIGIFGA